MNILDDIENDGTRSRFIVGNGFLNMTSPAPALSGIDQQVSQMSMAR